MRIKKLSPSYSLLWGFTAVAALLLIVFTFLLVEKDQNNTAASFPGYISGQETIVYLRSQPSESSRTVAVLNPGTSVLVVRSTTRDETEWYQIKTENISGWIPEVNLSLTEP